MSDTPSIVSAGYMPLDVVTTHDTVMHEAGGTAANVAAILAYLGWNAILAGQTGDDAAGDILVGDLKRVGVDTAQIHRPAGMPTPRLIHSVRPDGHFFSYRCPACRRRLPRSRPLTVEQARACATNHPNPDVYFFDRANAGTLALAEHYATTGAVIVFEPSVPANAELLRRAAAVAHIVKHSDDRSVGGLDDIGVRPRRGQLRIVTHGAEGLELRTGRGRGRRFAALATLAVDTGGAGDWTTAGLIASAARYGELRDDAIEDGLRFGQALAALSCTAVGARGLMRLSRRTVLRRARAVLAEGGVTTEPRYGGSQSRVITDACATCLLPESTAARRAASA
jgi:sugar/nucleoside kinase (ribokinase family)